MTQREKPHDKTRPQCEEKESADVNIKLRKLKTTDDQKFESSSFPLKTKIDNDMHPDDLILVNMI